MSTLISQIDKAESRFKNSTDQRDQILAELAKLGAGESPNWEILDQRARYKTRLERLGRNAEADAIANAERVEFNPLERILDANELSSIAFFERGVLASRAVARVQIRAASGQVTGFGSGTMISPRLFMTNNHVISDAATAASSTIQFEYLSGVAGPREPLTFRMEPNVFFETDVALDFTIVAIEESNDNGTELGSRGWNPVIAPSGKATVGERVNIIQHPGGERMQVTVRDNTIIGVVDSFLHYRADTQPGSSGSPVFNDQWEMAALHHAGKPKRDSNGRILMTNGQPWTGLRVDIPRIAWEANEGIRISKIVQHVNALNLSDTRKALWGGAQSVPPIVDIWSLFGIDASELGGVTPVEGTPFFRTTDEYGNPAWLFRVSFGPAPLADMGASPKTTQVQAAPGPSDAPPTSTGLDTMLAARKIVEDFHVDGPYYDAVADAAARDAYWQNVDFDQPSARLFPALQSHLAATHTERHSYRRARHEFLYPAIDLHPDGQLRNIYSGTLFSPVEAIAAELSALIPFAEAIGVEVTEATLGQIFADDALWEDLENSTQLSFNCEHVVCQSWFDKRQPMKADIHHLFACQPGCNSFRSNIPYWQFDPLDEAVREDCGRREGTNKFEPNNGKGAVARATMYFLMRYPGEVGDEARELAKSRTKILVDWHNEFPVDEYERHRNWLTQKAQGNRNPFIDFPDKVTQALLERGFG
ncbi:MAG: endonuclease [Woeseiaceae bacterium]|nr:endonuclease [Woeseiaceae bacterium]